MTTKDFEIWREKLGGKKNVSFQLFPDLNHLMITGEGKSTPDEYGKAGFVSEEVIRRISAWVGEKRP